MTDGAIRARARASARAIAVRLRNASAVMPDDTSAKPVVGSEAGQPMTKLAALNGVCWPTRISPALTSPSTTAVDVVVGDRDLEVLRRVAVGDVDGDVEVVDEDAAAVRAERRRAASARTAGSSASWRTSSASVAAATSADVVTSTTDESVPCSASISRSAARRMRVGAVVGDDQALGRPEQHHRGDAVALHLDLGARDGRRAGADDLAHLRDRLGAESEGGDAGRSVDAEHVGDAELAADDEHGRVDRTVAAGDGWDDDGDPRHAGDDRRCAELVGDARVARLAGRHEQSGRGDRGDLLADAEARLGLEAPVAGACITCSLKARQWAMASSSAASTAGDTSAAAISSAVTRSSSGVERDAVEAGERVAHRVVAAVADVLDQRGDRRAQLGVEDVGQPAGAQRGPRGLVHRRPPNRRITRRHALTVPADPHPSVCVHWSVRAGRPRTEHSGCRQHSDDRRLRACGPTITHVPSTRRGAFHARHRRRRRPVG